jgi:hypothetical protein
MPAPTERSGSRLVGRVIVATLLALAALPAYLTISPAWRPGAVRLACAVAVAVGCARARRWARDAVVTHATSPFDAPPPPPPTVTLDPRFLRLRDDLVASTRRRRYFDAVLWPRLIGLAGRELPRPVERRASSRRGPSLGAIEDLIDEVEKRP